MLRWTKITHTQRNGGITFQVSRAPPKVIYDTQVAFNIAPVLGLEAKADLLGSEARIRRHYALLAGDRLSGVSVQLLHAPVFHSHGISLAGWSLRPAAKLEHVEAALERRACGCGDGRRGHGRSE